MRRAMTRGDGNQLRLLVLDEPTASCAQAEVDNLFAAVQQLRDGGTAVVFSVGTRLDEVFAVADRVTVIRDGRVVDERPVRDFDQSTLIEQILGRTVDLEHREERRRRKRRERRFSGSPGSPVSGSWNSTSKRERERSWESPDSRDRVERVAALLFGEALVGGLSRCGARR